MKMSEKRKENRNADTHDDAAAESHGGDHDNHHEPEGREDVALQLRHLTFGKRGLVRGVENVDASRQIGSVGIHGFLGGRNRAENICVAAFNDLQERCRVVR